MCDSEERKDKSKLSALLTTLFPRTIERLNKCSKLRDKVIRVEVNYRAMGQANFGSTGDQLALLHFCLAMEFEKLRYWWMKPIRPLQRKGS